MQVQRPTSRRSNLSAPIRFNYILTLKNLQVTCTFSPVLSTCPPSDWISEPSTSYPSCRHLITSAYVDLRSMVFPRTTEFKLIVKKMNATRKSMTNLRENKQQNVLETGQPLSYLFYFGWSLLRCFGSIGVHLISATNSILFPGEHAPDPYMKNFESCVFEPRFAESR